MKTLKDFLNERQLGPMVVKNPDEQKFVDKHVVQKHDDRNGNGDDVFKASKVEKADRKKDRHGYEPGEDEAVYEGVEAEQIDEVSTKALASYTKKADSDVEKRSKEARGYDRMGHGNVSYRMRRKNEKRRAGQQLAYKKASGKANVPSTNEEVEQIDELSKNTLHSYIEKSSQDVHNQAFRLGKKAGSEGKYDTDKILKSLTRQIGIAKAAKKLSGKAKVNANEEAGLDEKINMDKASMGDVIKDFRDSNAPQFKGKSDKKRRAMAIAAKLTAERGSKGYTKEERLLARLEDVSESHKIELTSIFSKLSEENQNVFLKVCESEAGIEQMLDFAIQNRGK